MQYPPTHAHLLSCVDLSWAVMKRLEELADYNSATVKNSMGTVTGGRDNGAPVSVIGCG